MEMLLKVVSAGGIFFGAILMLVSIIRFGKILDEACYVEEGDRKTVVRFLGVHRFLMVMFLAGYLAVLAGVLTGSKFASEPLVAGIFFFGAVFVLIGVNLEQRMLKGVRLFAQAEIARREAEERFKAA